jgi:hypothetical protein
MSDSEIKLAHILCPLEESEFWLKEIRKRRIKNIKDIFLLKNFFNRKKE